MTIDFTKIKLESDELKNALKLLLDEKAFTSYVAEAVTNREGAARSSAESEAKEAKAKVDEFRNTNVELNKKIEALNGVDLDEYERLKKVGGEAGAAAEKLRAMELEHKGVVDGLNEKITALTESESKLKEQNATDLFQFEVRNAIGEYNRDNDKVPVAAGAEHLLVEQALKNRKVVDGKLVMLKADGSEFTTDSGIGTMSEWIGGPARESFPFLFKAPEGSGAPGNNSPKGDSKTMTRQQFDSLPQHQKMEASQNHKIVDG